MRRRGRILSVDCLHGFGFIAPDEIGPNVHFDKRNLINLEFDPDAVGREVLFRPVRKPGCRCPTAHHIRAPFKRN
jgi:cold shock CspA family protein